MKRLYMVILLLILVATSCSVYDRAQRKFLRRPAITTSFADTNPEILQFNHLDSIVPQSLLDVKRTDDGDFILTPGFYEATLQSFCIKAGTYGPNQGEGYLYASLEGPSANAIKRIISRYGEAKVSQQQAQMLIWSILVKSNFARLTPDLKIAAAKLLTPAQLADLGGRDILRRFSSKHQQKLVSRLPPSLQRIVKSEAKLRMLLADAKTTYDQIERFAVLSGNPPIEDDAPMVARGQWSSHPNGYFIRYFPRGYQRMRVQIYLPSSQIEVRQPVESGSSQTASVMNIPLSLSVASTVYSPEDAPAIPANSTRQRLVPGPEPLKKKCNECQSDYRSCVRNADRRHKSRLRECRTPACRQNSKKIRATDGRKCTNAKNQCLRDCAK